MGKIPVDLNKKETEAGWQQIIDDFALKATPVWFSWVGWLFALSGLQYLYAKGKGILLALLIGFSIGALWIYFQAFFTFGEKVKTIPLYTIVNGDAVFSGGNVKTFINRYEQEKRWAWGVTDVSYTIKKFFTTPHINAKAKFKKIL